MLFTRRGRGGVQQVKADRVDRGDVHPPRRPLFRPASAHARGGQQQGPRRRWPVVGGRRAGALQGQRHLLGAVQHAARGRAGRPARGPVQPIAPTGIIARGKRPVREIDGIDERLALTWSRRRAAIEARRRELAAAFQAEHGRPPTAGESVALGKRAWSETRQAKHAPRVRRQSSGRSGGPRRSRSSAPRTPSTGWSTPCLGHRPAGQELTEEWVAETAAAVVEAVQEDRATWQVWHLRAEASRRARAAGIRAGDVQAACDRVVAAAIDRHCIGFNDPDPLTDHRTLGACRGPDPGRSDPRRWGQRVQPARRPALHLPRDRRGRAAHPRGSPANRGGRAISGVRVGIAVAEAAANGTILTAAQQALVREMATSGRRVQLALAPAGTGKTTALRVLPVPGQTRAAP